MYYLELFTIMMSTRLSSEREGIASSHPFVMQRMLRRYAVVVLLVSLSGTAKRSHALHTLRHRMMHHAEAAVNGSHLLLAHAAGAAALGDMLQVGSARVEMQIVVVGRIGGSTGEACGRTHVSPYLVVVLGWLAGLSVHIGQVDLLSVNQLGCLGAYVAAIVAHGIATATCFVAVEAG